MEEIKLNPVEEIGIVKITEEAKNGVESGFRHGIGIGIVAVLAVFGTVIGVKAGIKFIKSKKTDTESGILESGFTMGDSYDADIDNE